MQSAHVIDWSLSPLTLSSGFFLLGCLIGNRLTQTTSENPSFQIFNLWFHNGQQRIKKRVTCSHKCYFGDDCGGNSSDGSNHLPDERLWCWILGHLRSDFYDVWIWNDAVKLMMNLPVMVSECALLLILHPRSSLPLKRYQQSRVLTPSTALGNSLVERLTNSGYFEIHHGVKRSGEDVKNKWHDGLNFVHGARFESWDDG